MSNDYKRSYDDAIETMITNKDVDAFDAIQLTEDTIDKFIENKSIPFGMPKSYYIKFVNLNKEIDWKQTYVHKYPTNITIDLNNEIKFYMQICIGLYEYSIVIIFCDIEDLKSFLDSFVKTNYCIELNKMLINLTFNTKYQFSDYDWSDLTLFLINDENNQLCKEELFLGINNICIDDYFNYDLLKNKQLCVLSVTTKYMNEIIDKILLCKNMLKIQICDENPFNTNIIQKICDETNVTHLYYQFKKYASDGNSFKQLSKVFKDSFVEGKLKYLCLLHQKMILCDLDEDWLSVLNEIKNVTFTSNFNMFIQGKFVKKLCDIVNKNNIILKINIVSVYSHKNELAYNDIYSIYSLYDEYKNEYNSFTALKSFFEKYVWATKFKENGHVFTVSETINMHRQKRMTLVKRLKI